MMPRAPFPRSIHKVLRASRLLRSLESTRRTTQEYEMPIQRKITTSGRLWRAPLDKLTFTFKAYHRGCVPKLL